MRKRLLVIAHAGLITLLVTSVRHVALHGQQVQIVPTPDSIESMDVCGDSVSKAFNGQSQFPCPNADQEEFNWATSLTHGTDLCAAGPEGVLSQAERIECLKRTNIIAITPNSAQSGATMLSSFVDQAQAVAVRLSALAAPRYVPVLLGHNDICGGNISKFALQCDAASDQDPLDYCRTRPAAFERELRKGLDILIAVPDLHIGLASLVRVSQLCNFGAKTNCQLFTSCSNVWSLAALGGIVGSNGICGSLTATCSDARISDAYRIAKAYRDILERVALEYAAIPSGSPSATVQAGGEVVGGAVKASGVSVAFSDASWRYKLRIDDLNCCDCFHPSRRGQNVASRILFEGVTCTPAEPCCRDTGDPVADGRCLVTDTDGRTYRGLF